MPENETPSPSLSWGIKRSFIDYIFRMPDGHGSVTDGATLSKTEEFVYEWAESARADDGGTVWKFRGDVRLSGHHGLLYVRIADPWLSLRDNRATVSIADPFDEDGIRIDIATADLGSRDVSGVDSGVGAVWAADPVLLSAEATGLFNDVYREGEEFDPMLVRLPREAD
nr:HtaA domain-containing protein [Rhodococcus sp. (in: high G+C Gram-positive bacteria)]